MNIKTLTGSSIHSALIEARRIFGDDVVLLESIPAEGDSLARITVMIDTPVPSQAEKKMPASRQTVPASGDEGRSFGYGPNIQRTISNSNVSDAPANYSSQLANFSFNSTPSNTERGNGQQGITFPYQGNGSIPATRPRNTIFAEQEESSSLLPARADQLQDILEAQLKLIHDRLDILDRRFEEAIIGASIEWTSHPLFARLLKQGMRPSTVTRLFEKLMTKGIEADDEETKIRWSLAHEIRNMLRTATPKRYTGTIMFVGPSGAGKTSLLLKIAKHPSFFGRHNTTIISILPEENQNIPYQNPASLYTEYDIPVQTVRNVEEMELALDRANNFDQILIDTPSMPVHEARARKMLLYLKRIIEPLLPIQVHLVLNATRALDEYDLSYIQRLPIRPDSIAFTHLDETKGLGRLAEWMIQTKLPVQFASSSPITPDGVGAFTPSWFVEEMMHVL